MKSKIMKQFKEKTRDINSIFRTQVNLRNGIIAKVDNKAHVRISEIARQIQDLIDNDGIENIPTHKIIPLSLFTDCTFDVEFIKCKNQEEDGIMLRVC